MATTAPTQTLELRSDFSHGNAWQLMSGTIWTPSPAVNPTAAISRSLDFLTLLTIIVSPTFRKYAAATSMLPP